MKYMFPNGRFGVIQGNQETARKCYAENLKLKRIYDSGEKTKRVSSRITPLGETCKGEKTSSLNS